MGAVGHPGRRLRLRPRARRRRRRHRRRRRPRRRRAPVAPPPHPRQAEARRVARAGGGDDDGDGGALPGGAAVGKGAVQADRPLVRLQRGLLPRDDAGSRLLHEHDGRLLPPRDRRQRERGRGALARVGRGALGRQGDEQPSLRPPEPGAVAAAGDDAAAVGAARRRFGGAVAAVRRRVPDGGARGGAVGRQGDGRAAVRRALGVVGVDRSGRRHHDDARCRARRRWPPPVRAPASAPAPPILCAAPARRPAAPHSPRRLQRARRLFVRGGDGAINMRAEVRTGEGETGWAPWTSLGAPLGETKTWAC